MRKLLAVEILWFEIRSKNLRAMDKKDALFPIAMLIDDLKNDDANARINSVRKIDQIAVALGPKRTREEFIPFLCECVDDDDEILIELAQELNRFVDLVGGPAYAHVILAPLRLLTCADSKLVRDVAIEATLSVSEKLSDKDFHAHFIPLTMSLIKGEWYNHRTSGIGLAHYALRRTQVASVRADILESLLKMCQDPLPMVRRTVAECLPQISEAVGAGELTTTVLQMFKTLGGDSQDSVRAINTNSTPNILVALNNHSISPASVQEASAATIGLVKEDVYRMFVSSFCADESWRVRYSCADVFINAIEGYLGFTTIFPRFTSKRESPDCKECNEVVDPMKALEPEQEIKNLNIQIITATPAAAAGQSWDEAASLRIFTKFVLDIEPEVRCMACQRIVRLSSRLSPESVVQVLVPALMDRANNDEAVFVRSALARNVVGLAQLIGKDESVQHLKPIVTKLIEDKSSDVRVSLLLNLPHIIRVTTIAPFSASILPCIVLLAEDADWRVRKSVIQAIPALAKELGQAYFDSKLSSLCLNWLSDSVNYIRRAAVRNLVAMSSIFGNEWVLKTVIPKINNMKSNSNYLHRINALFFLQEVAPIVPQEIVCQHLLPVAIRMASDSIPNVRFMAAEVLGKIAAYVPATYKENQIKTCLLNLKSDGDVDVKAFAADAIKMV